MRITDHKIFTILLGAAIGSIGSIVTCYNSIREKRIVSNVRRNIERLAYYHALTPGQYRKTIYPTKMIASTERILEFYYWARQLIKEDARTIKDYRITLHPTRLAAEAIICEELLGLSRYDAYQALLNAKKPGDLRGLLSEAIAHKGRSQE